MADLLAAAGAVGCAGARAIGQSGKLVFRASDGRSRDETARALQAALAAGRAGLSTDVLVLSRAEWAALLAADPLDVAAGRDPARCFVMVLADEPSPQAVEALGAALGAGEAAVVAGRLA